MFCKGRVRTQMVQHVTAGRNIAPFMIGFLRKKTKSYALTYDDLCLKSQGMMREQLKKSERLRFKCYHNKFYILSLIIDEPESEVPSPK